MTDTYALSRTGLCAGLASPAPPCPRLTDEHLATGLPGAVGPLDELRIGAVVCVEVRVAEVHCNEAAAKPVTECADTGAQRRQKARARAGSTL